MAAACGRRETNSIPQHGWKDKHPNRTSVTWPPRLLSGYIFNASAVPYPHNDYSRFAYFQKPASSTTCLEAAMSPYKSSCLSVFPLQYNAQSNQHENVQQQISCPRREVRYTAMTAGGLKSESTFPPPMGARCLRPKLLTSKFMWSFPLKTRFRTSHAALQSQRRTQKPDVNLAMTSFPRIVNFMHMYFLSIQYSTSNPLCLFPLLPKTTRAVTMLSTPRSRVLKCEERNRN